MIREALTVVLCCSSAMFSQVAGEKGKASPKPFDVFIAKEHRPDVDESMNMGWRGGSYFAQNAPLEVLLMNAYAIRENHIFGLKGWESAKRWDLQAKWSDWDASSADTLTDDEKRMVVQTLLTSLFALKVHHETRFESGYELRVVAGGVHMTPHPAEGAQRVGTWHYGIGSIDCVGVDMKTFLFPLENKVGRPVVDRTGLTGLYDLNFRWSELPEAGSATDGGPSLATALKEQLGLELRRTKVPVEVLVVDEAEQPRGD